MNFWNGYFSVWKDLNNFEFGRGIGLITIGIIVISGIVLILNFLVNYFIDERKTK